MKRVKLLTAIALVEAVALGSVALGITEAQTIRLPMAGSAELAVIAEGDLPAAPYPDTAYPAEAHPSRAASDPYYDISYTTGDASPSETPEPVASTFPARASRALCGPPGSTAKPQSMRATSISIESTSATSRARSWATASKASTVVPATRFAPTRSAQ